MEMLLSVYSYAEDCVQDLGCSPTLCFFGQISFLCGETLLFPNRTNQEHPGDEDRMNSTIALRPQSESMLLPELIRQAQAGDESAFEQLYHRHKGRVYSLCLRMVRDVSRAEDLTQDTFLQVHRKIGTFRGESQFSTWIHRLAVNVVLMALRKKSVHTIAIEEATETDEGKFVFQFGTEDMRLRFSASRITLERAIGKLSPGYRLIFILHDIEGYEHNQIADMLGCSIGNSKSQLHKGRVRLRQLLRSEQSAEEAA